VEIIEIIVSLVVLWAALMLLDLTGLA